MAVGRTSAISALTAAASVMSTPSGCAIDADDVVAAGLEVRGEVAADEPGSASDQDLHRRHGLRV